MSSLGNMDHSRRLSTRTLLLCRSLLQSWKESGTCLTTEPLAGHTKCSRWSSNHVRLLPRLSFLLQPLVTKGRAWVFVAYAVFLLTRSFPNGWMSKLRMESWCPGVLCYCGYQVIALTSEQSVQHLCYFNISSQQCVSSSSLFCCNISC